MKKPKHRPLLRKFFGKGRIEVLFFVEKKIEVTYSDVRDFCLKNKIVGSRGTVNIILRDLTNIKLLQRRVMATRPVRTIYRLTQLGRRVVKHLKIIEQFLKEA